MKNKIFLHDIFGNQMVTRNSIARFLDPLSRASSKEIILDFSDIHFISRSCADEYMKWRVNNLDRIIVKEINMNERVSMMFKLVKAQYKKNFGLTV